MSKTIKELTQQITDFRDEREWRQFHKPKDMALSLLLESSELAEHFQWKSEMESQQHLHEASNELGDELADCLYWVLLMAHDFGIDLAAASDRKLAKNREKYPVAKFRGSHRKYNS